MTAIIIIAIVLLLIFALLSVRVKFNLSYSVNGLKMYAKVLFFKYYLAGEPEKTLNIKHFKIKRFRKRRDKAIKKYNKELLKKKSKKLKQKPTEEKKKKRFSSPSDLINTIKTLLDGILVRFPKYLHLDIKRFVIEVGGEDAHKTALLYGTTVQGMQYLITGLNNATKLKRKKNAQVGVTPNFLKKTFRCEADFTAHISVYGILKLGIKFLGNYFKLKSRRSTSVSNERTAK